MLRGFTMDPHHWLLDAVVETRIPLHILCRPDIGLLLNRPAHGLSVSGIATLLADMVQAGEVAFRMRGGTPPELARPGRERIRQLIERPGGDFEACCYGLTKRGGAEWEKRAEPDWSRFNSNWWCLGSGGVEAASLALAEELLELRTGLDRDRAIVPASVRKRRLRPWRATYWKTLPDGHRILYRHREVEGGARAPLSTEIWERWVALSRWR